MKENVSGCFFSEHSVVYYFGPTRTHLLNSVLYRLHAHNEKYLQVAYIAMYLIFYAFLKSYAYVLHTCSIFVHII